MELKLSIGDPKSGKTYQKVLAEGDAKFLIGKRIGEIVKGEGFGFSGYEFKITGGSDYCGFPMRPEINGSARKKVLAVSGIGIRKNRKGRKLRRTMAGNTIYAKTAQVNLKVEKAGKQQLAPVEEKAEAPASDSGPQTASSESS
ncbi:MAG: S6e family ribosomal protein [Nanoarchaeota archaeon]